MSIKGFNWRARQSAPTVPDAATNQLPNIQIEGAYADQHYDAANPLVLPSAKSKVRTQTKSATKKRVLSKKQRKRLEKIVESKKKKAKRQSLLEELEQVQAKPEEVKAMISIAQVQTKGLKRHFHDVVFGAKEARKKFEDDDACDSQDVVQEVRINSIKGAKRLRIAAGVAQHEKLKDPNVVGFEDDDDEDEEIEAKEEEQAVAICPQPAEVQAAAAPSVAEGTKATYVGVARTPEMQAARLRLPILGEEQQIMECIGAHDVVIVAGETGSGKTTQVPQFLYEAGYALDGRLIGVTEPRRVAAVAMATRVAAEMALPDAVSYLIRFAGTCSAATRIKFMTDGVLLREIQRDFLLTAYAAIVLDEAHERSASTDILVGLLSRIVPLRRRRQQPLKLVVMSATLRVEDFTRNTRLFRAPPPCVRVRARQFPVRVHFSRRTSPDYMRDAFAMACKVHARLPAGAILVFVTGQQEVNALVRKLRLRFPLAGDAPQVLASVDLDDYELPMAMEDTLDTDEDEDDAALATSSQPLWTLPLYSLLPAAQQARVFSAPPPGCRLCVVATNVAETSLTIPGVRYVIDTGRTKTRQYDAVTGVSRHVVQWTSRASAEQRAGRAGRTGAGHCYRLYSSAVFVDAFAAFAAPDIQRKPVDDLYLQMRCMGIERVAGFPFPSAPDLLQLRGAAERLTVLGALAPATGAVTHLGRAISRLPVLPRYGKMLALSHQHDLLPHTICLVAALSVPEVLLAAPHHAWEGDGNRRQLGDLMVLLSAVSGAEAAHQRGDLERFCAANGLRLKAVTEVRQLRKQLTNDIQASVAGCRVSVDPLLPPPTDAQARLLRQVVLAGMGDQVARKLPAEEAGARHRCAYQAMSMEAPVFLHRNSALCRDAPEFLVYQEVYETSQRMYMRTVTAIDPTWLPTFVPHLCQLGQPLSDPEPIFDALAGTVRCYVRGSFGAQNWPIPQCQVEYKRALGAYRWFARFLLEGQVAPALAKYASSLLSAPATMVKSWAKLQPRTDALLKALMRAECSSRRDLCAKWDSEPQFLLEEYLQWLPSSAHAEVSLMWPPREI